VRKPFVTAALAGVAILLAGAVAIAVATSVSTTPEPAFISHFDDGDAPATPDTAANHVVDLPTATDDSGHAETRRRQSSMGPAPVARVGGRGRPAGQCCGIGDAWSQGPWRAR